MIVLHRLGHQAEPFYLSPEMIMTVEANPDTVVTLTTGAKIIVHESPQVVVDRVRRFRAEVLIDAMALRDNDAKGAEQRRAAGELLRIVESLPPAAEAS
jgi:flagellar protein FlbD